MEGLISETKIFDEPEVISQVKASFQSAQSTRKATKAYKQALREGNIELAKAYKPFTKTAYPETKGSIVNLLQLAQYNIRVAKGERVPVRPISAIGDIDIDLVNDVQARQMYNLLVAGVKTPEGKGFGLEGLNIKYGTITENLFPSAKAQPDISYHGASKESAKNILGQGVDIEASKRGGFFTARTIPLAQGFARRAAKIA